MNYIHSKPIGAILSNDDIDIFFHKKNLEEIIRGKEIKTKILDLKKEDTDKIDITIKISTQDNIDIIYKSYKSRIIKIPIKYINILLNKHITEQIQPNWTSKINFYNINLFEMENYPYNEEIECAKDFYQMLKNYY